MREYEVYYDGWITPSEAAFARLGRALITHHAKLTDSFTIGNLEDRFATISLMIKIDHRKADDFAKAAKIRDFQYRAPVDFDNGTLRPRYKTPEEELEVLNGKGREETDKGSI